MRAKENETQSGKVTSCLAQMTTLRGAQVSGLESGVYTRESPWVMEYFCSLIVTAVIRSLHVIKFHRRFCQEKKGHIDTGEAPIRSIGKSIVNGSHVHFLVLIIATWLRKVLSLGGECTGTLGTIFAVCI